MRRRSLSDPGKGTTRNEDSGTESPLLPYIGYLSDAEGEGDLSERLSARMANFRLREHRNSTVAAGGASKALGSLLGVKVPSPSFGLSGFEAPTIARFFVTRVGLFRVRYHHSNYTNGMGGDDHGMRMTNCLSFFFSCRIRKGYSHLQRIGCMWFAWILVLLRELIQFEAAALCPWMKNPMLGTRNSNFAVT